MDGESEERDCDELIYATSG